MYSHYYTPRYNRYAQRSEAGLFGPLPHNSVAERAEAVRLASLERNRVRQLTARRNKQSKFRAGINFARALFTNRRAVAAIPAVAYHVYNTATKPFSSSSTRTPQLNRKRLRSNSAVSELSESVNRKLRFDAPVNKQYGQKAQSYSAATASYESDEEGPPTKRYGSYKGKVPLSFRYKKAFRKKGYKKTRARSHSTRYA